jgi:hypothetical protein
MVLQLFEGGSAVTVPVVRFKQILKFQCVIKFELPISMQNARKRQLQRVLCIAYELLALIALVAAWSQAIHATSGAGAKRTSAAGAAIVTLQQRLRTGVALATTISPGAAFLGSADRAVIAQE